MVAEKWKRMGNLLVFGSGESLGKNSLLKKPGLAAASFGLFGASEGKCMGGAKEKALGVFGGLLLRPHLASTKSSSESDWLLPLPLPPLLVLKIGGLKVKYLHDLLVSYHTATPISMY